MTEFVFEAIFTRFKANSEFYKLFFEACAQILLYQNDIQIDIQKPDILLRFLKKKEVLDKLNEMKHRAFDFLEDILK